MPPTLIPSASPYPVRSVGFRATVIVFDNGRFSADLVSVLGGRLPTLELRVFFKCIVYFRANTPN